MRDDASELLDAEQAALGSMMLLINKAMAARRCRSCSCRRRRFIVAAAAGV